MKVQNKRAINPHESGRIEKVLELLQFEINNVLAVVKDVVVYSNSRLKVIPDYQMDKEIIISREKVPVFKSWIDGNPI